MVPRDLVLVNRLQVSLVKPGVPWEEQKITVEKEEVGGRAA